MTDKELVPRSDDPWTLIGHLNGNRYRIYQRDGYRIWLNVSESRDMARRAVGGYEPEMFEALGAILPVGGTFLDIGANKGDFSLFAATRLGPAGRVIAVEPHPENAEWVRRSAALNGFSNVAVEEAALANEAGTARLYIGPKSGHHALDPLTRDRGTIPVAVTTLDDLCRDRAVDRLDAIKIDVEGAEDRVIAGGRQTLDRFRPPILLDVHDIGDARLAAMATMLGDLGYRTLSPDDGSVQELMPDRAFMLRA